MSGSSKSVAVFLYQGCCKDQTSKHCCTCHLLFYEWQRLLDDWIFAPACNCENVQFTSKLNVEEMRYFLNFCLDNSKETILIKCSSNKKVWNSNCFALNLHNKYVYIPNINIFNLHNTHIYVQHTHICGDSYVYECVYIYITVVVIEASAMDANRLPDMIICTIQLPCLYCGNEDTAKRFFQYFLLQ